MFSYYSKANYAELCNFLSRIDFSLCELLSDVDSIWNYVKHCITTGMLMFIPKVKISPSQTPKWYISNIRHQIKCLHTVRNKCKHHPTDHNHLKVQTELQNSIQAAKVRLHLFKILRSAIIPKYSNISKA